MAFLDERFPIDVNYGATFSHIHSVDVTTTVDGSEFRTLNHPYVRLNYDVTYENCLDEAMDAVADLYDRANGKYRAFRVKDLTDYSTNDHRKTPTALDMPLYRPGASTQIYQLVRWYGEPTDPECARRVIKKPVSGTVKIANDGVEQVEGVDYTVDYSTGLVTFAGGYKAADIWAIGFLPTEIVVGVVNANFEVGDDVRFSGLTANPWLNGMEGEVLETIDMGTPNGAIRVAIDPTGETQVPGTETGLAESGTGSALGYITGGCEFDIPCRFDSDFNGSLPSWEQLQASGLVLLEVFNP